MKRLKVLALAALACAVLLPGAEAAAAFSQQAPKLIGTGAVGGARQGSSVALSADGNTAIVSGPEDDSGTGAAWILTRSGGAWTQQGDKLIGSGFWGDGRHGASVALSADGSTAIVGGPDDDLGTGAAWVFVLSGGAWAQQGDKLVGTSAAGSSHQGWSVALSADGSTAVVGGPDGDPGTGAAWVFTRSGGVWAQQGPKLVGTGAAGAARQGVSVALSADGNTAVVGGSDDDSNTGAAWVFTRSSGAWTQQGPKLVDTLATGFSHQGISVALSGDGDTAILGGWGDSDPTRAAWVFVRSGGTWAQQGSKLVGSGTVGSNQTSVSVALSSDGNTAIMGGWEDSSEAGAAWVFTRSGDAWTQQGNKLVGTGAVGPADLGFSVALSANGDTAIVGGPRDKLGAGAAWVFVRSSGTWTQQGSKLVGSGTVGGAAQGASVALSADGNTAIVGGPGDDPTGIVSAGAAWVFTRSSSGTWAQQGKLVGTGAVSPASQGVSVALSADGNTAIVGGPADDSTVDGNVGAAWVFVRSGGTWAQQGTKLVGTGATGTNQQGVSVALSADGNTAILGARDSLSAGAAWVFTRSSGAWAQQGTKLVGTGAVGSNFKSVSVALSADGKTAILGSPDADSHAGAAWVFTRSGGAWTQQGSKLVGTGAMDPAWQGASVALSFDGNTAIVGGFRDNSNAGAAWVFTRSSGTWTQQGSKLVGTGAVYPAGQGASAALSADGNIALVGGYADNTLVGAAWVFTRSGSTWTQQGTKLVGTGAVDPAFQSFSVALSADGNTATVGGPMDDSETGAAWVYVAANKLAFTTQPSGTATSSTAFGAQPTVTVQDASGNTVTGDTSTVTLALTTPAGATLTCTGGNSKAATAGVATFAGCQVDKAGTYTLTATDGSLTLAVSTNVVVSAGAANKLVFTTQPGGGTGGTAWPTQPVVTLQDAYGNTVTGTAQNVTLAIQNNAGPGGVLGGTKTVALNTATGQATFTGLSIDKGGTGYTLTATGSTVSTTAGTVVSSSFNVAAGSASKLVFTTQPGGGTGGTAWPTQPVVTLQDAGGNTVTGDSSTVTLTLTTPGGATLSCTGGNGKAATAGVATFAGCQVDKAGTYTLTATDGSVTSAVSTNVVVSAGAASQLAFTTNPSGTGASGTPWAQQPVVNVQDASGNTVTSYATAVTLALASGSGSGTLSCTTNPVTPVNGVATFAGCQVTGLGTFTLKATSGSFTNATTNPTVFVTASGDAPIPTLGTMGLASLGLLLGLTGLLASRRGVQG